MASAQLNRVLLIVEDCDEDFDTALTALKQVGYGGKVYRAENGDECLALLRGEEGSVQWKTGVILMDLNMPGNDGRETLRTIKADPTLKHMPVVVFTTSNTPSDLRDCYQLGCNAYHVKPFKYPDHLNCLQDIFHYWLQRVWLNDNPPTCTSRDSG